ncbi:MAG: tetratricopeptide repeat protein [Deferribacterales bacterium]
MTAFFTFSAYADKGFEFYKQGKYADAVKAWKYSADTEKDNLARYNLAYMYRNGTGTAKNMDEAVRYYKLSASYGETRSQSELCAMYNNNDEIKQDFVRAFDWCSIAADDGDGRSMYYLGIMYLQGRYVKADINMAGKWWEKGAEAGHETSIENTVKSYCYGMGGKQKDLKKCAFWAKKIKDSNEEVAGIWKELNLSQYDK